MKAANNATTWMMLVFESDLPAPAKLTCAALRTFMNAHMEMAWPSVGRLSAMTSYSERTIQGHLKLLCERKFLLLNGRSEVGTNRYLINLEGAQELHPAGAAPRRSCGTPPQELPKGGAGAAPELNKINNNNQGARKFRPPSADDVAEYCRERGNGIDAQEFVDHYAANGWMRGKTKIKDWRACVRTWERRRKEDTRQATMPEYAI